MSDPSEQPLVAANQEVGGLAETRLHEPADSLGQREQDIALAAELVGSGILSERQVTAAVTNWSIHGSVSLAQHLKQQQILNDEQLALLHQRAAKRIQRAKMSIASQSGAPNMGASLLGATLERLDDTGKVAKLLGVTVASSSGADDSRVSDARYQIVRKLGQGGLGRVWLARDLNMNRHVALKEISHPSRATEQVLDRFRHEAEITGRLEHPGIVPVYQLGLDEATDRAFYTMRFLGKQTLQDTIAEYHERREAGDDDPMLLRRLLTAFVNICHAMAHAHSRNVIHRDLKPENVVIDSYGQVIVIDWGLAKVIDDVAVESLTDSITTGNADQTSEGQVLGTPLFMAPEQAAGRLAEVDQRTDIYGLGAILFAIVTGYAPHEKTQQLSANSGIGVQGMISSIASGDTPQAREVNPDADPALEAICSKAMSRRRYARYQQAEELGEDVQRWMAGEPVSAYKETQMQRLGRWIATHNRLSQAIGAVAMITLVALTTLAMSARQNHLDFQQERFAQMEGDVRAIELQLSGIANELGKDARFIAALPPIQGILNARAGVEGDDELTWQTRLQSIYASLLRSNPNYLALSFVLRDDVGSFENVRVERNPKDPMLVRVLPAGRLLAVESDPLLAALTDREPGDVKLSLDTRPRFVGSTDGVTRLSVATPVYSEIDGECAGMALIEADVTSSVEEVLIDLGGVDWEIYVGDGQGQLWIHANPQDGVQKAIEAEEIPNLPTAISQLIAQDKKPFRYVSENQYIAERLFVDPSGRGALIFVRLPEEE